MTWVFAFSWAAVVEIFLGTLVLFALVVYGGRETTSTASSAGRQVSVTSNIGRSTVPFNTLVAERLPHE